MSIATDESSWQRVAVIGEGSMGVTLAQQIATNGTLTTLCCLSVRNAHSLEQRRSHWMFPEVSLSASLRISADLASSVEDAGVIIVAVPSSGFRCLVEELAPHIQPHHVVLSATKGFDPETNERMSEVLRRLTRARAVGAISGPNITTEIMRGCPTVVVVASSSADVLRRIATLLSGGRLRVHANQDLIGVELIGALKNVVAIATGIALGLQLGVNACSVTFARGLAEIRHLAVYLGALPLTFSGLSGISDLYLTCTSADSLNRRLGVEIGRGRPLAEVLAELPERPEGLNSVIACHELAKSLGLELPIAAATYGILNRNLELRALERALLEPPLEFEVDNALLISA